MANAIGKKNERYKEKEVSLFVVGIIIDLEKQRRREPNSY